MFLRPCWKPKSDEEVRLMIEEHPWAMLVSQGDDGPLATNLPLMIDQAAWATDSPALVGHLSRANEHFEQLRAQSAPVLAVFEGPWSYVTASWYPKRQMPPTYYYTTVHCYGRIEFQEEPELDVSLEDLTQRMESPFANGWSTSEIPRSEITRRFAGIAGFRIVLSRVDAKFKLGQDEPVEDALAVADVLDTHASPNDRALAAMIRQQNAGRGE